MHSQLRMFFCGTAFTGLGLVVGMALGGQGEPQPQLFVGDIATPVSSPADPTRQANIPTIQIKNTTRSSDVVLCTDKMMGDLKDGDCIKECSATVELAVHARLAEKRKRLDDRTPKFDYFEGSMTRLLGNPELALEAWALRTELKSLIDVSYQNNQPLPPSCLILDRIKNRLGDESFQTMATVFGGAPITNEAEFTRYLYAYRHPDGNGNMTPLVLRDVTDLAIWFLSRETARQWGYLR